MYGPGRSCEACGNDKWLSLAPVYGLIPGQLFVDGLTAKGRVQYEASDAIDMHVYCCPRCRNVRMFSMRKPKGEFVPATDD